MGIVELFSSVIRMEDLEYSYVCESIMQDDHTFRHHTASEHHA